MTTQRRIARIVNVPPLAPGFAGPGHTAAPVISMEEFARTDPFIALMDDHLDMGERQVGGAHPHAGFETVTLVLDGTIHDPDEGGLIHAGESDLDDPERDESRATTTNRRCLREGQCVRHDQPP